MTAEYFDLAKTNQGDTMNYQIVRDLNKVSIKIPGCNSVRRTDCPSHNGL